MTKYVDMYGLSQAQMNIMQLIQQWAKDERVPIPKTKIMEGMREMKQADSTTQAAILTLVRKHYIRRAIMISNQVSYVQLRRV